MHNREEKIEVTLFAIALAVAILLRFLSLGSNALTDAEASQTLQAFHLANGNLVSVGGQPGYVALTTFLFYVFPASNFWARFWPALFGSLLVLVPLLYKPWIGKRPALLLAFVLALEPGLTAISRTAGSEMMVITCILAALGFFLRHKPILAGISAGLAILAGTPFWLGAATLALSLFLFKWVVKQDVFEPEKTAPKFWTPALISAGATLIAVGTLFGTNPLILSGLGSGLVDFFTAFVTKGGVSISIMLLGLLLTQVLIVPLAIFGIAAGPEEKNKLSILMIFWLLLLFVLTLLPAARQVVNWAWFVIPLSVLAVIGLEALLGKLQTDQWKLSLVEAAAVLALIVYSYLNLLSLVNNPSADSVMLRNQVLAVVLPVAMILVVTLLVGWGWSFVAARQGLVLGVVAILGFVTFGNTWKAAGLGPRPEAELWRSGAAPVGAQALVSSVEDISLYTHGLVDAIDVKLIGQTDPALQWALREFADLKTDSVIGSDDTTSVLVSDSDLSPSLNSIYRGQSIQWKSQIDYSQMDGFDWIKWFDMRDVPKTNLNLLLWARNDLFKGSSQN
ncbi:MAG: hypothetical protein VB013_00095 [Anaerolineaceae bacterium]|nr:hypothetical protein [Anaerolineaceae bacterium]